MLKPLRSKQPRNAKQIPTVIRLLVLLIFVCLNSRLALSQPPATNLKTSAPVNSIGVIVPYWYGGTWVFDDAQQNLTREPFIAGIPEMIDELVKNIPNAKEGFRLLFSAGEFPDYSLKLTFVKEQAGGAFYSSPKLKKQGWLCPSLFKYFPAPPAHIYIKAEALKRQNVQPLSEKSAE